MIPVRDTATSALRLLLHDQPTSAAKVKFAWQIAAGAAIDRAAEMTWTPNGTVTIRARDLAWRREITHARATILERMQFLLGPDAVRRLVVAAPSSTTFKE
jgi:hypothetical protein